MKKKASSKKAATPRRPSPALKKTKEENAKLRSKKASETRRANEAVKALKRAENKLRRGGLMGMSGAKGFVSKGYFKDMETAMANAAGQAVAFTLITLIRPLAAALLKAGKIALSLDGKTRDAVITAVAVALGYSALYALPWTRKRGFHVDLLALGIVMVGYDLVRDSLNEVGEKFADKVFSIIGGNGEKLEDAANSGQAGGSGKSAGGGSGSGSSADAGGKKSGADKIVDQVDQGLEDAAKIAGAADRVFATANTFYGNIFGSGDTPTLEADEGVTDVESGTYDDDLAALTDEALLAGAANGVGPNQYDPTYEASFFSPDDGQMGNLRRRQKRGMGAMSSESREIAALLEVL